MDVLDYTGAVKPGGPAQQRDLEGLSVTKISVGPMDNNAYLLSCRSTGESLLVDAANDPDRLLELIRQQSSESELRTILTTHRHYDHWQALGDVVENTGARTLAHPEDAAELPITPDGLVSNGDSISVGDATLEVIHLRGHTPGSVALLHHDADGTPHLFTGDSLFPGGVGKTWSTEDFHQLLDDVERRLFDRLPDDTWFYPGHGDDSTIGEQRPQIGEWRERGW